MVDFAAIAELAVNRFAKAERVRALEMMNTPTDYDKRRDAFIELAQAQAALVQASRRLNDEMEK